MIIPVAGALILARKLSQLTKDNQYQFNVDSLLQTFNSDEIKIDRKIASPKKHDFQEFHQDYYSSRDL